VRRLEVRGLGKARGPSALFEGVSFEVGAGEAVAIMGPSGSGKTTLLRCLNGLERADAGLVVVGEARLDAGETEERFHEAALAIRRRVGFVFQGFHLFQHRTVLDNVMEGPVYVKGEAPAAARTRALAWIDRVGVAHRADAYPDALSGGEQQRAAIARALAMDPEVLLLDEPTSALDEARTDGLVELLGPLVAAGLAIVTVTHDAAFARKIASRTFRLEGARLVGSG
jgi:polar amino acid transport system ATP-binding protein